jgi:outer membrane protein TolC
VAENNRLPSVSLGGTYASRNQSGTARQAVASEIPRGVYPESRVEFRIDMPLWDEGVAVESRNAAMNLKRLNLQEEQLVHTIRDELRLGQERVRLGYEKLNQAKASVAQNRAYYTQLLRLYSRGRYSAVAIKNALDALTQSENLYMQSRVDFNISLVRYDFSRHRFLERYADLIRG